MSAKKGKRKEEEPEEVDEENSSDEEEDNKKKRKTDTKGKKEGKSLPVSKSDFLKQAKQIKISIDGHEFTADPKEFSSGSFGWGLAGKVVKIKVGNEELPCQVSINLPVRGSKEK